MLDLRPSNDEERRRLDECAQEPIRIPGSIQPHGVLIAVDPQTLAITLVSENCEAQFGMPAAQILGRPIDAVVGVTWATANAHVLRGESEPVTPVTVDVNGRQFDTIIHSVDDLTIVEFEPAAGRSDYESAPAMYQSIHRLTKATSEPELLAAAAREIRALTGFDRVMVYHFHSDDHGEVVAEERADDIEPFLGLHFPASDIPSQARELYLTKLSRMIVSSAGEISPLLSEADGAVGMLLDLSRAELRSVSPFHLQFMRNMGQVSTLSLSLIRDGRLIGMITLAHRTPRHVPFILRQGLEVMASQVALQLGTMIEIRRLTQQMRLRSVRAQLVHQLGGRATNVADIGQGLLAGELTILDLIAAQGAMLHFGSHTATVGITPPVSQVQTAIERMGVPIGQSLVVDSLPVNHPELAALLPSIAGLLVVPLPAGEGFLAWFRHEIIENVEWLGDQSAENRLTPLSPRTSFASWTQSVSGRSPSWDGLESEAEELARDIAAAMVRETEAQLAALAMHDALTGLPNRRLFMERLERELREPENRATLTLLFVDIDSFKSVNDTHGHDAGDAVLTHVGRRILAVTRPHDTVARLGGDEFVVMCQNTTYDEAAAIAERIVESVREPFSSRGVELSITASIGVAAADLGTGALELLRTADTAMYRAKSSGRNQTSR